MKKAVIVVGSHYAGKSKTITKYFKPLVGLSGRQRVFGHVPDAQQSAEKNGQVLSQTVEERNGQILSQSIEEKGKYSINEFLDRFACLRYFVCAARPAGEKLSHYETLKIELEDREFIVGTVEIVRSQNESYYEEKAKEIYRHLFNRKPCV